MKIQVAILRAEKIKSTSGVSRVVCRDRAVICFLINEFNANKVTNHQRCTLRLNLAHLGTNIAVHWCNAELLCRPLSTCCSCLLSVGDTVKNMWNNRPVGSPCFCWSCGEDSSYNNQTVKQSI